MTIMMVMITTEDSSENKRFDKCTGWKTLAFFLLVQLFPLHFRPLFNFTHLFLSFSHSIRMPFCFPLQLLCKLKRNLLLPLHPRKLWQSQAVGAFRLCFRFYYYFHSGLHTSSAAAVCNFTVIPIGRADPFCCCCCCWPVKVLLLLLLPLF